MFQESSGLLSLPASCGLVIFLILLSALLFYILKNGPRVGQIIAAIAVIFSICVSVYTISATLTLKINAAGISFSYPPLMFKDNHYLWAEVKSARIFKFDAFKDFGGWGLKSGTRYGTGYLSTGYWGLYVIDKNNNRITVTVLDSAKAAHAIKQYFKPAQ